MSKASERRKDYKAALRALAASGRLNNCHGHAVTTTFLRSQSVVRDVLAGYRFIGKPRRRRQ